MFKNFLRNKRISMCISQAQKNPAFRAFSTVHSANKQLAKCIQKLSKENRQETKLLSYINKNDNKTLVQKLSAVMDHQQTNQSWPHIFFSTFYHI